MKNPPGMTEEYYCNYRVMGGAVEELYTTAAMDPELPPCNITDCDCEDK